MKYFGTVRQKLGQKIVIPPPPIKTFSIPKIIATVKDSPTENFGTVRQKIFDRKSSNSPPLCGQMLIKLFVFRRNYASASRPSCLKI